ncbi:MAG: GH6 [uncultured Corynebacteriales bacterium]|uniref:Glucanase n=1 Tax=uncultured Mycobacteriales bacterium TaxID=581187 RepID=A0A6J4HNN3_9ACTN|nr:MAG: GH6 [uncultured Corynebacteriales bacterium]
MREAGAGRLRGRWAAAGLAVALAAALAACGTEPDTTLRPDPPAVTYAPLRQPFEGATLFLDRDTPAARWQRATPGSDWLDPITTTPQARWVNGPPDLAPVPALARRAARRGELLVVVAYWIPDRGCAGYQEGAPSAAAYERWVRQLAGALGRTPAVVVLEPDAVPADCFGPARAAQLAGAVRILSGAGHAVYLDAGHSAWKPSGETADRLLASGVAGAEGFAVNVSNRQPTRAAQAWGRELSDLVGGRPFVVDVSRNGLGRPPDEPGRDDEWCNPARQGLGVPPTTRTGRPEVDALLWIKRPGESDGICGGEDTYLFSPRQARTLIANGAGLPAAARRAAAAADIPARDG